MKNLNVYELFKGYNDVIIPDEIDKNTITLVTTSISEIKENSVLFVTEKAFRDTKFFDVEPLKIKPLAVVLSRSYTASSCAVPIIRVGNVREALAYALSNSYGIDYRRMKFIGITGTNGKTTTATIISEILKDCGYKVGFIGTGKIVSDKRALTDTTYSMTTPDPTTLYKAISEMSNDGCQYVVMEVSSHSIALKKIAPIFFDYAIFTNLDNDHLDFHKTKEEYFRTKLKLFKSTKKGLFNIDDRYSRLAYKTVRCEKSSFGIIHQADAYATDIELSRDGVTFYYRENGLICKVTSSLIGAFNVYNILAALKCVIDLGIPPCLAKRSLQKIQQIEGRMELINGDVTVIIDYAHTPFAFYNSLKSVKQCINNGQNITVVFGCGGDRDPSKRPTFGKYAEELADKIIITEDNSRNEDLDKIISDITSEMRKNTHTVIKDRESAIRYAISSATPGDTIVILGKGHEKYKITKSGYIPFDEKEIATSELERLRKSYEDKT
jgi:UDP-N-acetylmuramoyl-L-alanyl-D-glutamate--2,6-diaminopimelate ligase